MLIDDVEIGDDWEADGPGDGAPAPGEDGNASSVADETIARVPDVNDTDNDVVNFEKRSATIGSPNSPPPALIINEIVTDPKQDWNDSSGGDGIPFSEIVGAGSVSASDQWIELYNASPHVVNLSGWTLELMDMTPSVVDLEAPGASIVRFSDGSTALALQPGGFVVIGDPPGSMSDQVHVLIRHPSDLMADDVEIGDDPEGDGTGDGAPAPSEDGNSTGLADESIGRLPNGSDTDDDIADFAKLAGSIGEQNVGAVSAPETADAAGVLFLDVHSVPWHDTASLTLRATEACRINLAMHDLTGRRILDTTRQLSPGANRFSWTVPKGSGIYWIRVSGTGESGRRVELTRAVPVIR
jgi:hypothetical protein